LNHAKEVDEEAGTYLSRFGRKKRWWRRPSGGAKRFKSGRKEEEFERT
jgi:hypothetical protein